MAASGSTSFPQPTIPSYPELSDSEDADNRIINAFADVEQLSSVDLERAPHRRRAPSLTLRGDRRAASRIQPPAPSSIASTPSAKRLPPSRRPRKHRRIRSSCGETRRAVSNRGSFSGEVEFEMESFGDDEEAALNPRAGGPTKSRARVNRQSSHGPGSSVSDDEEVFVSKVDKKEANALVVRNLAINAILIGLWYLFSLVISIYNKWMFSPEKLDFHFPLFVSCGHMIVQFCLSSAVLYAFPQFRPPGLWDNKETVVEDSASGHQHLLNTPREEAKKRREGKMTRLIYLTKLVPCGAATGLDIGLGNMSLKFISLTFYTMCKSSSLGFVLIFAFAFGLEKATWKLVAIITVMTIGVVLMVASEAQFVALGFILVFVASALSGLRWSLTQMLLLRNPATSNPFSSIFYLAPCMFLALLIIAIPVEGFGPLLERIGELADKEGALAALAIVLIPGCIAFLMVSSEFALLKRSSVVTLSICGIFKEVMTISASAIIFGDPLTPLNLTGLSVTIMSIAAYNYIKISKMRQEAVKEAAGHHHQTPVGGYAAVEESDSEDGDIDGMSDCSLGIVNDNDGNEAEELLVGVGESATSPAVPMFGKIQDPAPTAPPLPPPPE